MIMTDLGELKTLLDIDPADTQEDVKLAFLVTIASNWIEELLDRPGLTYKERTEIYNGTGTHKLLLRSRPVYTTPTVRVFVDRGAYYGAGDDAFSADTELEYGTDFTLRTDPEDSTKSRSGILLRLNGSWYKPIYRQQGLLSPYIGHDTGSIKVIYTGGYTVDTLPTPFRLACNLLVTHLRYVFPLGVQLNSDSYQERNISVVTSDKEKLLTLVKPLIWGYRNWKF